MKDVSKLLTAIKRQFPKAVIDERKFREANPSIDLAPRAALGDKKRAATHGAAVAGISPTPRARFDRVVLRITAWSYGRVPADSDGIDVKGMVDALVAAGFMADDAWDVVVETRVRSRKAKTRDDVGVFIEIIPVHGSVDDYDRENT